MSKAPKPVWHRNRDERVVVAGCRVRAKWSATMQGSTCKAVKNKQYSRQIQVRSSRTPAASQAAAAAAADLPTKCDVKLRQLNPAGEKFNRAAIGCCCPLTKSLPLDDDISTQPAAASGQILERVNCSLVLKSVHCRPLSALARCCEAVKCRHFDMHCQRCLVAALAFALPFPSKNQRCTWKTAAAAAAAAAATKTAGCDIYCHILQSLRRCWRQLQVAGMMHMHCYYYIVHSHKPRAACCCCCCCCCCRMPLYHDA